MAIYQDMEFAQIPAKNIRNKHIGNFTCTLIILYFGIYSVLIRPLDTVNYPSFYNINQEICILAACK